MDTPPDLNANLLGKAILLALVTLDTLPENRQVTGERDDMVHMLHLMIQDPAQREALALEVEGQTSTLPDITDWAGRPWQM